MCNGLAARLLSDSLSFLSILYLTEKCIKNAVEFCVEKCDHSKTAFVILIGAAPWSVLQEPRSQEEGMDEWRQSGKSPKSQAEEIQNHIKAFLSNKMSFLAK